MSSYHSCSAPHPVLKTRPCFALIDGVHRSSVSETLRHEPLHSSHFSAGAGKLEAFAILQASGPSYPDDIWNFNLLVMSFHKSGLKSHCQSPLLWENGFREMWAEGGSCMCGGNYKVKGASCKDLWGPELTLSKHCVGCFKGYAEAPFT